MHDLQYKCIGEIHSNLIITRKDLERALSDSRQIFEHMGADLQSVYSSAKELINLNSDIAGMINNGSNSDQLKQVGSLANESLQNLMAHKEKVTLGTKDIQTNSNHLLKLRGMLPEIKKISKNLLIASRNIAIESSLSHECENMFSFFVNEIKDLAQAVDSIFLLMDKGSEISHLKQIESFKIVDETKKSLEYVSDTAAYEVRESIQKIEHLISKSLESLLNANRNTKKISEQVNEIVVAIQFHDIARQQIEHVVEALLDLEELCNQETVETRNKEQLARIGQMHVILTLQAAQTRQVIEEIEGAHLKIASGFNQIKDDVNSLLSNMSNLGWIEDSYGDEKQNHFSELLSVLENLNLMMHQGYEVADRIKDVTLESTETLFTLSGHMKQLEDISMDLHIKAINAIIMSRRLKENGRALSVLAEYVTEISKDSKKFISEVVEILKLIENITDKLKFLSNKTEENSDEKDIVSLDTLSMGIKNVSSAYDTFRENFSIAVKKTGDLQKHISQTLYNLSFLDPIEKQLTVTIKRIDELADLAKPFISIGNESAIETDQISKRYTMASERDIHSQTFGNYNERNLSGNAVGDDFGENVELF